MKNHNPKKDKKNSEKRINIYYYLDYRKFLSDLFYYKKEKEGFTYRHFAKKAGFSSHAFLKQVIMGIRQISIKPAPKIARGFALSEKEAEFLEYLVRFNQAEDLDEKNNYYKKIIKFRPKDEITKFDEDHLFIISNWFNMAIREMVNFPDFNENHEWIAKNLYPRITKSQAKEAIETMLRLGYLTRDENGKLTQATSDITTGAEIRSLHAITYHRNMFELASWSLKKTRAEYRDISSVILSVDKKEFDFIKERIKEFRKEIMQYLRDRKDELFRDNSPDRDQVIYNMSIQFFNLSKNKWER